MITRQKDRGRSDKIALPYSPEIAKNKIKIIVEIQKKAIRIFSEEIARMWYAKTRLEKHTMGNLKKLNKWMDTEIKNSEQRI
jgi:hypothetical protein